jgi:hypothetical protein
MRRVPSPRKSWREDWRRWAPSEHRLLFVLTVVVGVCSGLAAVAFHSSIDWLDHHVLAAAIEQPATHGR